jgi:hypothetical protein
MARAGDTSAGADARGPRRYCLICCVYDCELPPPNAPWDWATMRAIRHIRSELAGGVAPLVDVAHLRSADAR